MLEPFTALRPLRIQWYGLATTLLAEGLPLLDLAAESGPKETKGSRGAR